MQKHNTNTTTLRHRLLQNKTNNKATQYNWPTATPTQMTNAHTPLCCG